ncbi:hypothetical protein [Priestia megaterium]|uniref:hypothetical protein n=1 Tax=Priestia megaterium TaxID=1404 RepID=UPI003008E17E
MTNQQVIQQQFLDKFLDFILVKCPNCELCARVVKLDKKLSGSTHSCTCPHCGYLDVTNTDSQGPLELSEAVDPFFQLPLYLETICPERRLWAYNLDHLQYIESYIEVKTCGACFDELSVEHSLPDWVIHKQEEALSEIQRLKDTVFCTFK